MVAAAASSHCSCLDLENAQSGGDRGPVRQRQRPRFYWSLASRWLGYGCFASLSPANYVEWVGMGNFNGPLH